MKNKGKAMIAMDIIAEIVGEAISALFELIVESNRIPRAAKVFLTLLIFLPMMGLFVALAVLFRDNTAAMVLWIAVSLLFAAGIVKTILKIFRS